MTTGLRTGIVLCLLFSLSKLAAAAGYEDFRRLLGDFPKPPPLRLEILNTEEVDGVVRHLVQYVAEEPEPLFDRPIDVVRAYVLVPAHRTGDKLPAIVAIHQDGPETHLGKSEPAGLAGANDQHYGLELCQRGYVVICPDRYYHAERRRIPDAAAAPSDQMRDLALWLKWAAQLISVGRTHFGKEAYDLSRAVDVLWNLEYVDRDRIGAIGHSAGGNALVYFMFTEPRVKVGVSSCGFYELLDDFNDRERSFTNPAFAVPGLTRLGRGADFVAGLAPRPFLMTRGLSEMSNNAASARHVESTRGVEEHARGRYQGLGAQEHFRALYFDGGHEFPEKVRREAYDWLDAHLQAP